MEDAKKEYFIKVQGKVNAWRLLTYAQNHNIPVKEIMDPQTKTTVKRGERQKTDAKMVEELEKEKAREEDKKRRKERGDIEISTDIKTEASYEKPSGI
jgi:hypothetical protein